MSILTVSTGYALRMDQLYLVDLYNTGDITETSPTRATVEDGARRTEFTGTLQYVDGQISDGTITGVAVYTGATLNYAITNLSFDAADFADFALFNQRTQGDAAAFAGADTMTGADLNDVIYGYGGADTLNGGGGNDTLEGGADADQLFGGVGMDTLRGGDGIDILDGGAGADLMYGGAGDDIYYVDDINDDIREEAGGGTDTVYSSVSIDYYDIDNSVEYIENITLTGHDDLSIQGNLSQNILTGNDGDNTLDGKEHNDTMIGGLGDDVYYVDEVGDVVIELAGEGNDTVRIGSLFDTQPMSYSLVGTEIENLSVFGDVTGTGNDYDNILIGEYGSTLYGLGGNDTLKGDENSREDLYGGAGDDTYVVGRSDIVHETSAADGVDTVMSAGSYKLTSNVENLILTGTAAVNGNGTALANSLTGNSAANTLSGGAGNDILDGGAGADTLLGGADNDTYVVDNVGDMVSETAAENGVDTVLTSISYQLTAYVENLTLAGNANLNGGGNSLANILTGNSGNNTLNGYAGADTMYGGAGDDVYVVDDAGDKVRELSASDGIDRVQSSVSYKLTSNVENLTLTGTSAINGNGTSLANSLNGNSAANTLSGGAGNDILDGGAGADTLLGGANNDTYVVDNQGDIVRETSAADGIDTVVSSISYKLTANVENLTLTGNGYLSATGTASNNILIGNYANNKITGGGGADTLTGGGGENLFVYKTVSDSSIDAFDRITDLHGEPYNTTHSDKIDLGYVDADINTAGNQAFFIVSAFTHVAGQMTLTYSSTTQTTAILMDVDGDGDADMKILLNGDHHDFINFVF